ncbi:MAG: DUF2911 domain-containing protein [Flavobacteriales bacterium]|nr:DUF2911 domain-containing protein [Flavobacteriales bacterium]
MRSLPLLALSAFTLMAYPLRIKAQYTLLDLPRASQAATVQQRIGITELAVAYSRPGAKGRTIWGDVVPYDQVWRAGANENTTFTCTDPITVEGTRLPAGTYGLHIIPTEGEWTFILSTDHTAWGSYFYKKENDAVRANVATRPCTMTEQVTFGFSEVTDSSAVMTMRWGTTELPIRIGVDVHGIILAGLEDQLRGLTAFGWEAWYEAAHYCHEEGIAPERAMKWVDISIARQPNFENRTLKATLLEEQGKTMEAAALRKEMIDGATNAQLNTYAYQLANRGNVEEAVRMFALNAKRHPKDPNVHDSLGEGYMMMGNNAAAIKAFKKSLDMNPPENVKANSLRCLKKLGVDTSGYETAKK